MRKVAVAMAVYKRDRKIYLTQAIESILGQTYVDFVLYIAVDGAVDEELQDLLVQYELHPKVVVLWFDENKGLAQRLNDIIDVALIENFKYVARMDADDVSYRDRLMIQIGFLSLNPDVDVLGAGLNEIDENGRFLFQKIAEPDHSTLAQNIIKKCPFNHPTVVFDIKVFSDGFRYRSNLKNTQDYYLWVDLLAAGKCFANIREPLLDFRIDRCFYSRRGFEKAMNDFGARIYAMRRLKIFTPVNILHACALFILRISPSPLKKLAYKYLR